MIISCEAKPPQVLILILNYNQKKDTSRCIESLKKISYSNYSILLVDNNSTDGSIDVLREKFPDLKIIEKKENLGCAGGRNVGIGYFLKETKGDYLFFLDNDTEVDKNLLDELIKVYESSPDIGIAAMKVYYYNQPNKFWIAGGAQINWWKGNFYNSGQGEMDYGQFDGGKEIDSVPGGFTFIKRKVLEKVGKLDERYFIYFEDSDWCLRVKRAGFKIAFAPLAKVWHRGSSSLGMESPGFYYYRIRNRLLFMKKHVSYFKFMAFLFFFFWEFFYCTLLTLFLSKRYKELQFSLKGIVDFFLSKFGQQI